MNKESNIMTPMVLESKLIPRKKVPKRKSRNVDSIDRREKLGSVHTIECSRKNCRGG